MENTNERPTSNRRYLRSKAHDWTLGEHGDGGMVAVSFKAKDTDGLEKFMQWRGFFTEKTAERTIESLRAMGFEGDDISTLAERGGGLDKNEVELVVEDEEYEGKTYARVQFINKPRGAAVKTPLVGDKAKAFAASLKAKFHAHDAAAGKRVSTKPGTAAPQGGPPEPPPLTDADLPF